MNTIVDTLIKTKISKFVFDYREMAKQVFLDKEGKLIHPLEFGVYREKIVSDLIKPFLPKRLDVGTGFIVAADGSVSTQCDIVVFDRENTPVLESNDQRFFPVECVAGVVEVKSTLTKETFKEAIIKLAEIKKIRDSISSNIYIFKDGREGFAFNTKENPRDQIATFLICESVDMNLKNSIDSFFQEIYKGRDKSLFHNMILSINDGCFLYYVEEDKKSIYHSYLHYDVEPFKNIMIIPNADGYKYDHILIFLNYFYALISSISIMYIELTHYLIGKTKAIISS